MSLRTLDVIPDIKALNWPQRDDYTAFGTSDAQVQPKNASSNSSRFLRLPRELRDMVYIYFLEANRSAPPSPPFAGPRILRLKRQYNNEELPQKDIAYPVSIAQSNIVALLQTHRQIRSEIIELADKRNQNSNPLPADLDIMATGYVLYPLWTRLPLLNGKDTPLNVTVNLRIFSPEAFSAQHGPPRRPCSAAHGLNILLCQFITCGPAFTFIKKTAEPAGYEAPDPAAIIDTLTVRLENYDIYTPRMFAPAVHEMVRMCKALSLRADASLWLREICVVEGDAERRRLGLAEREWRYLVATSCDDYGELLELESLWNDMGVSLQNEVARFRTSEGMTGWDGIRFS